MCVCVRGWVSITTVLTSVLLFSSSVFTSVCFRLAERLQYEYLKSDFTIDLKHEVFKKISGFLNLYVISRLSILLSASTAAVKCVISVTFQVACWAETFKRYNNDKRYSPSDTLGFWWKALRLNPCSFLHLQHLMDLLLYYRCKSLSSVYGVWSGGFDKVEVVRRNKVNFVLNILKFQKKLSEWAWFIHSAEERHQCRSSFPASCLWLLPQAIHLSLSHLLLCGMMWDKYVIYRSCLRSSCFNCIC